MRVKKKNKIWCIIGMVFVTVLLVYFYRLPYYYSGKIKGGYDETYMNEIVGRMTVSGRPISLEELVTLKGRNAITFSTEVEISPNYLKMWREEKRILQVLDLSLFFKEVKLPFEIDQIEKIEVRISDEYTMYEADGTFFGAYDPDSGKLVGKDKKPLILILNHEIFSHKNNWKVFCDMVVTLNDASNSDKSYTFRCPLKATLF